MDKSIAELADEFSSPKPDDIQFQLSEKLQKLSQELADKVVLARRLEEQRIETNKRIYELSRRILPELMDNAGTNSITTQAGAKLELVPYFKAGLPVDMDPDAREQALAYLREKAPEIIKTEVKVSYDTGQREQAEILKNLLLDLGVEPEVIEGVHHMTLTSWVRDRFLNPPPMEEGKEPETIPFHLLNAEIGSIVKVTLDKSDAPQVLQRVKAANKETR
jgi:hypothetical protein